MPFMRLPAAALLLTIAAASGAANAQNTVPLQLEWTSPTGTKTCVFTTDSNGVTMVNGGAALRAKGSFATADCPSVSTPPPTAPEITNGIDANEIPSTTTAGATHSISWSAANAESCNYSSSVFPAAVTGWPTSGAACTSATDCAATRNVSVTMPATAGTYNFVLTCTKSGFSPVTSSRSTTISSGPPPAGCVAPAGLTRLLSGRVSYNDGNDRNVDLTQFENVFGHDSTGGANRLWPGSQNLNQRIFIPRNNYVALRFTVPSNFHVDTRGQYRFEETAPTASVMSLTVSKSCGDLSATPTAPMTTKCVLNGGALNSALTWGKTGLTARCQLEPGETYYLNIIHANLNTPTTSGCANASCANTIQNQNMNPSSNPTIGWP